MLPRITRSVLRVLIVGSSIALLTAGQVCEACAPAPRFGEFVRVLQESAIIIWDADTRTEHFIRRASFNTSASDFGFLVPTPSQPSLAQVSNAAFTYMADLTKPKTVVEETHGVDFTPLLFSLASMYTRGAGREGFVGAAPPVRVLDVESVAGYDAAVLEADNPAALGSWLAKHDYESGPDIKEWLEPYIAAHWKLTAFKIAKGSEGSRVGTSAVRMSFTTDRPFFPYREPASQRAQSPEVPPDSGTERLLGVFFLGDARVEGQLGTGSTPNWPGATEWSDRLTADELTGLASELALTAAQLPKTPWLTSFEDSSPRRPGFADLYFARSETQSPFTRPNVVEVDKRIPVPIDVVLFLAVGLIGVILLARLARRRKAVDTNRLAT